MRTSRVGLGLALCVGLLWMAPAEADAQRRPGQGTVRLSLDAQVIETGIFPDGVTVFGLGVDGRGLGPGFGYAITDDILIGARTAFGIAYYDPPGPGDGVLGRVSLLPYFEIVFGSEGLVPYVGAQAGFSVYAGDGFDAVGSFIGGAYGGVHVMLTDTFSFSPFLELSFLFNNPRSTIPAGVIADDRAGFGLAAGFSLMGWIGDVQEAVGGATDDGFDTSGTDDGIFNDSSSSGGGDTGGGGGGSYDDSTGDNTENTAPPPSSDPEGGLE